MKDFRSIIIIFFYALMNSAIIWIAFTQQVLTLDVSKKTGSMAPEFTIIETLEYFHLKNGIAQMSLSADNMKSQGEELAEFFNPRGFIIISSGMKYLWLMIIALFYFGELCLFTFFLLVFVLERFNHFCSLA